AIKALYSYENAQLLTGDAPRLKKNLIAFISQTPSYAEAILLLSCFRRDATAITFLQHHGKLYPKTTTQINAGGPSAAVPVPVCCDLSLARLGDAAALGRVQSYLKQEGSKQQEFIFDAIRWINEKAVLLQMVELLKDKHNLKKINFEHYGATQTIYLRVCDVALKALNYKAGFSNHYYLDPTDKVSDAELERAYPKLKQFFVDKL
ncbi:MAG: hypothetical protein JOZ57_18375, partial [Abitibacteriaceae bacterium]|nr:hypothetical protein [Abditibacteriaceae bacterium]